MKILILLLFPIMAMADLQSVNNLVNKNKYVVDGSDYWSTPKELFKNGGDCEDFAIAKYFILLSEGVPASKMRLNYTRSSNKGHMVLVVNNLVLDNQTNQIKKISQIKGFSFNDNGIWYGKRKISNKNNIKQWVSMKSRLGFIYQNNASPSP